MQTGVVEAGLGKAEDNRPKAASDGVLNERREPGLGEPWEPDGDAAADDGADDDFEMTGFEEEARPEEREIKVLPLPQPEEAASSRSRGALHEQAGTALLRAMSPPGFASPPFFMQDAAWARSASPFGSRPMSPTGAMSPAYPPNIAWPSTPEFSPVRSPMDEPMRVPEGGFLDDIALPSAAAEPEEGAEAGEDAKAERPQLNLAAHLPEDQPSRDARAESLQFQMMRQAMLQQAMLQPGAPYGLFGLPGAPFPGAGATAAQSCLLERLSHLAQPAQASASLDQPSPPRQSSPRQAPGEPKEGERRARRRGARGSRSGGAQEHGEAILPAPAKDLPEPSTGEPRTTVMLRNMPNNQSRAMLMELLDREGFAGQYDFLYLPMDFVSRASLGYAFINFAAPDVAAKFMAAFNGFSKWSIPSRKVCGVSWSAPHQGLASHVERYKNSPVMHEDVPDAFKPVLLCNGARVAFPPPTRKLRAPQLRSKPA